MMTYSQFINLTELKNAYHFCGDSFLATKCIEFLKQKLNIQNEYDISKFDSENFSCDAIIESCEQISFFAKKRLCVVKDIKNITEKEKQKLSSYIQNINFLTTLIFVDTLNLNTFDFLNIEKIDLRLNDYELATYVINEFKKSDKEISKDTALTIINFCLKDLIRINLEIKKLVSYNLNQKEISLNDVKLLVPSSEEIVVFELTNMIVQRDAQKSLNYLFNLMGNAEQNSKIFNLLSVTFQRMFFCVASKNISDEEIAKTFSVKPYAIKKLKQQSKNFSAIALKDIVYELCDLEYYIKNGKMSLENALVYIVIYIINK